MALMHLLDSQIKAQQKWHLISRALTSAHTVKLFQGKSSRQSPCQIFVVRNRQFFPLTRRLLFRKRLLVCPKDCKKLPLLIHLRVKVPVWLRQIYLRTHHKLFTTHSVAGFNQAVWLSTMSDLSEALPLKVLISTQANLMKLAVYKVQTLMIKETQWFSFRKVSLKSRLHLICSQFSRNSGSKLWKWCKTRKPDLPCLHQPAKLVRTISRYTIRLCHLRTSSNKQRPMGECLLNPSQWFNFE